MERIVSGGQTGIDRAALDAALAQHFPCGGWCPAGRIDEDGLIPEHYPLKEMKKGGYHQRTNQNILDSCGTLILYHGNLEGGTANTVFRCIKLRKPFKLIDAAEVSPERAVELVMQFLGTNGIETLNVAGPRASKWPEGAAYGFNVLRRTIGSMRYLNDIAGHGNHSFSPKQAAQLITLSEERDNELRQLKGTIAKQCEILGMVQLPDGTYVAGKHAAKHLKDFPSSQDNRPPNEEG